MRAKLPVEEGFVERDGVKLHYEVYGDGQQTIVFVPPWSIVHARVYKAQLPYFSERFRCITFDGRGNGGSDRPEPVEAYTLDNYVADLLAVMDATEAGQSILVGLSFGGMLACTVAAHHPQRVKALVLAGTSASIGPGRPYMTPQHFLCQPNDTEGWNKYTRAHFLADYPDFAAFFVANIFSDPHSTKQIEDGIEWAADTTGEVLARSVQARAIPPGFDVSETMYRSISCPILMIHGDDDQIQPYARAQAVAAATGAELVTIPGGGHNPLGRYPAKCNALIVDFLDRRLGIPAPRRQTPRTRPSKRALYISSPIGLGHGRRDLAITRELRRLRQSPRRWWKRSPSRPPSSPLRPTAPREPHACSPTCSEPTRRLRARAMAAG